MRQNPEQPISISVLKKRRDFLRARSGLRFACPDFTLQAIARDTASDDADPPLRLGLTVTKREGNAVVRNRIRRRLREALRQLAREGRVPPSLRAHDLVIIARSSLAVMPYAQLCDSLAQGLDRLVAKRGMTGQKRRGHKTRAREGS